MTTTFVASNGFVVETTNSRLYVRDPDGCGGINIPPEVLQALREYLEHERDKAN